MHADAREALDALTALLSEYCVDAELRGAASASSSAAWDATVAGVSCRVRSRPTGCSPRTQVIGMVNELSDPRDVVVCAAGSMPGDLHGCGGPGTARATTSSTATPAWATRSPAASASGWPCPDRDVFVMVGDGSYLMMATELVTAVQEGIKIITVLVQNHGYASIGSLSESLGSQRFGTKYRYRNAETGRLDGDKLPVDLAANAASFGLQVIKVGTRPSSPTRSRPPRRPSAPVVIYVETDPLVDAPSSRLLVGRPGERDVHPGVHPDGSQDLRPAQGRAATAAHADRMSVVQTPAAAIGTLLPPSQRLSAQECETVVQDHDRYRTRLLGSLVPQ